MQHSTSEIARLTRKRTEEIFSELRQKVFVETDRMFAGLMALQWVCGIAAAWWLSPRTWDGAASQVHIHIWAAVFLGGAISLAIR